MTQSSFHDIGGDAVDVSGTQLTVEDVRVFAIGDKGVSVGEASRAMIRGLSVDGADYGIVSKDMSHAAAEDVTIAAARVAGLAAYVKKPSMAPRRWRRAGSGLSMCLQNGSALCRPGAGSISRAPGSGASTSTSTRFTTGDACHVRSPRRFSD